MDGENAAARVTVSARKAQRTDMAAIWIKDASAVVRLRCDKEIVTLSKYFLPDGTRLEGFSLPQASSFLFLGAVFVVLLV